MLPDCIEQKKDPPQEIKLEIDTITLHVTRTTDEEGVAKLSFPSIVFGDVEGGGQCTVSVPDRPGLVACFNSLDFDQFPVDDVFEPGEPKRIDINSLIRRLNQLTEFDIPNPTQDGPLKNPISIVLDKYKQLVNNTYETIAKWAAEKVAEEAAGAGTEFPVNPLKIANTARGIVGSAGGTGLKSIPKTGANRYELTFEGRFPDDKSGSGQTLAYEKVIQRAGKQDHLPVSLRDIFSTAKSAAQLANYIQARDTCLDSR